MERAGPIVILEDFSKFVETFCRPDEIEEYMKFILKAAPMDAYYEFNHSVCANRVLSFPIVQRRKEMKIKAYIQAREKKI